MLLFQSPMVCQDICIRFSMVLIMAWLTAAGPISLFAQETDKEQYGIKAGINYAELLGSDAIPESDRKTGYSFGVYGTFKLTPTLKLQPEVIWSLQGEKSEQNGRYDISYINIPLMLKWQQGRFYTELGPQLGILTINSGSSVPDSIRLTDFETFDFSLNAGAGWQFHRDWAIGIRYCQGLTRLVEGRELRNSVLYVGLSYRIW